MQTVGYGKIIFNMAKVPRPTSLFLYQHFACGFNLVQ